jgi:predicted lipid carrier protein YhbT
MNLPRALSMPIDHAPLLLVQQGTELVFNQMLRQHPNLFDRLGSHAEKSFRFTPADLNLSFLIVPAQRRITVSRKSANMAADASASGPLLTLLALLEGRIDGDAMFFARSLSIAGDMEAMLALRNALDDSGFDLPRDLGKAAGPFAHIATRLAETVRRRAMMGLV